MRLHGEHPALDGMAVRYGAAKRNTFAQVYRLGCSFDEVKTPMCEKFGLPGRAFNSIEIDLKGMVKSRHEKSALDAEDAADKLVMGQPAHRGTQLTQRDTVHMSRGHRHLWHRIHVDELAAAPDAADEGVVRNQSLPLKGKGFPDEA